MSHKHVESRFLMNAALLAICKERRSPIGAVRDAGVERNGSENALVPKLSIKILGIVLNTTQLLRIISKSNYHYKNNHNHTTNGSTAFSGNVLQLQRE